MRLLSVDVYTSDQRAAEHRFTAIERDIEALQRKHDEDIRTVTDETRSALQGLAADLKALANQLTAREQKAGEWRRQALYAGIVPGVLFVLSTAVTVILALRSGK